MKRASRITTLAGLGLAAALALGGVTGTVAQTSSGPSGGGPSSSGPSSTAPSTSAPPAAALPAPATPSQRNLDMRPPGTSLPPAEATAPPQPKAEGTQPGGTATRPGQTDLPPSASKRPAPGGAGSSELSRENKTGKNALNETYNSCLGMWERATHMSRQEWARACRRVADRINNLQVNNDTGLGKRQN